MRAILWREISSQLIEIWMVGLGWRIRLTLLSLRGFPAGPEMLDEYSRNLEGLTTAMSS